MKGYKVHRFTWYWYVCRGGLVIIMQPLLFDALHVKNNQISCNIIVVLTWYFRCLFPRSEHLGAFVSFRPTYCIITLLFDINSISHKQGKKKKGFTHFFHVIWWKFSGCNTARNQSSNYGGRGRGEQRSCRSQSSGNEPQHHQASKLLALGCHEYSKNPLVTSCIFPS